MTYERGFTYMRSTQQGQSTPFLISIFAGGLLFILAAGRNFIVPSVFDWDTHNWPTGSLSQTYTDIGVPGTDFTYTFTGDTDRLEDYHSPETNQIAIGGLDPAEDTLFVAVDFENLSEMVTLTIDFSIESAGVSFVMMDIDSPNEGVGIDRVQISGFDLQNFFVSPVLIATDPACINILGNLITGLCLVDNDLDNGNVMVSFNSGVKKIVIHYLDGSLAGNPLGHGTGLHDLSFDPVGPPPTATPSPTPTSSPMPSATPSGTPDPTATPPTPTPPPPVGYDLYLPIIFKK